MLPSLKLGNVLTPTNILPRPPAIIVRHLYSSQWLSCLHTQLPQLSSISCHSHKRICRTMCQQCNGLLIPKPPSLVGVTVSSQWRKRYLELLSSTVNKTFCHNYFVTNILATNTGMLWIDAKLVGILDREANLPPLKLWTSSETFPPCSRTPFIVKEEP